MAKRLTLPTLSPERRRDLLRLPGLSHWGKIALKREHVEIDCRLDHLDLAVQQKLNPEIGAWRYHADRPAGHTKLETTAKYLNVTTQYLHELNERVPLTIVRARG